jgi:hypothetical protein
MGAQECLRVRRPCFDGFVSPGDVGDCEVAARLDGNCVSLQLEDDALARVVVGLEVA